MTKEPIAGRVKTRLGQDIGMTDAAWWFRHQLTALIRRLGPDPRWQTRLLVSPAPKALFSRTWPSHIIRDPQISGDLGQRMRHAFHNTPAGAMVLIGGDIPDVSASVIAQAFNLLGSNDFVFGPATDGGFWLVGMRRGSRPIPADLFQNIRWSSEHALDDTVKSIKGSSYGFVRTLRDIDTIEDLNTLNQTRASAIECQIQNNRSMP